MFQFSWTKILSYSGTLTCNTICADSVWSQIEHVCRCLWRAFRLPLQQHLADGFPRRTIACHVLQSIFRMLSIGSFSRISSSLRSRLKDLTWQNKHLGCDSVMFFKSQAYLGGQPLVFIWIIRGGLLGKGAAKLWCEVFAQTRQKAFKSKSHSSRDLPLGLQPWIGTVGSLQSVTDYPN